MLRAVAVVDDLQRDLLCAVRTFSRNKRLPAVALATLAIGIGANTAIFTVVDTVVFRPLPYRDPARLVKIWDRAAREPTDNVSWGDFIDLAAQSDVFEQIAADDGSGVRVTHRDGSHEDINGALVTTAWLPALGVQPTIGRGFLAEEAGSGRDRVAILSHVYWTRRFGGDPSIIGSSIVIDAQPFTIVGVLPPNVLRYGADVLTPLVPSEYPQGRTQGNLDVFARLKRGVTLAQAQAVVDTIAGRLAREYPATNTGRGFRVAPLGKYYANVHRNAERALVLMFGAVGLVLLIACANVTNLLLARAVARSRECVIRTALGASRRRLVRQMLVESALLFVAGGALGVVVARWSVDGLLALSVAVGYVPERMAVAIDGRVLGFTLLLSLAAGLLSGLAPALQASGVDLSAALRASGQNSSRGFRRVRASRLLVVSEIAVSLVLLIGSALLVRSFVRLQQESAGIDVDNLVLTISDGGRDFPAAVNYWRAALDRTRELPGVRFAAVTSRPPVHGARAQAFAVAGTRAIPATDDARAGDILISADYFRTMGIQLVQGRAFTDRDGGSASPVAVVSESLARRYFPDGNAVGGRISVKERSPMTCCSAAGPVDGVWREIVGVAADVRQGNIDDDPAETIYRPYSQIVEHDMYLMVRAEGAADAARLVAGLRSQLAAIDPAKEWADARLMQDVVDRSESVRLRRFGLILLGTFAALALLLAAVGTYGVMAFAIAERTREIGIRVALGATGRAVIFDVLGDALRLTAAGLIAGAAAAYVSTRFISSLLFGVSPADAVSYGGASTVLAAVALLASYIPARRALRIDPLVALREE